MKHYKLFLFPVFFFAFFQPSYAQNTRNKEAASLSGKITDSSTGAVLSGATISLPDLHLAGISKPDGSFQINNIPQGKYLVEVSYIGFASAVHAITFSSAVNQNFALSSTAVEQEAVTITGVSSATRIRQSPQPVIAIKREEFINTNASNTIDAITKLVPGVTAVSTGPAIAKPFIRGLGYNRVLTVNDGVRQEGQQWGDEHGIEIDDYSVQKVEVLKGPASLMYGSDALAGVINIQSQLPAPEGTVKADIISEYQTNNALRGIYGNIGGTKNGFSWNAYGTYKGAQDYKNKYDGYVFNSKFNNKDWGGMLGYAGNWGYSRLYVTNFDQHLGIVEGERDSATGAFTKVLPEGEEGIAGNDDFKKITPDVPFQRIQHFKVTTDNSFRIGNSHLNLLAGYQHNQRQEFGNPDDIKTPDAWFNLQTVNYSLKLSLPYTYNWHTTIGVTGMYQTNENKAEEALIPAYSLFDLGGFIYTQHTEGKLTVSGGIRYDNRHDQGKALVEDDETKFNAFTKNFGDLSGSIGLAYEASKQVALKFNIARGFRAPNFAELASNGAHEGTTRYEIGDRDLTSETSLQTDAGIEITSEHVSLDASLFYNHVHNFIFYEKVKNSAGEDSTLIDPEEGATLDVYRFDQKTANLYGAEFSLDIHPHPLDWLHFKNVFSYTRGKFAGNVDGSENIPLVPAAQLLTNLKVDLLRKGKFIKNLSAGMESQYAFKQDNAFTGFDTETPTSSYWLINAGISADVASKGKTLFTVSLTGENLGDIAYQNHLSRFKYLDVNNVTGRQGVFNMGRNFGIKIHVPLVF